MSPQMSRVSASTGRIALSTCSALAPRHVNMTWPLKVNNSTPTVKFSVRFLHTISPDGVEDAAVGVVVEVVADVTDPFVAEASPDSFAPNGVAEGGVVAIRVLVWKVVVWVVDMLALERRVVEAITAVSASSVPVVVIALDAPVLGDAALANVVVVLVVVEVVLVLVAVALVVVLVVLVEVVVELVSVAVVVV
mmetsp:Transcript_18712/g.55934  ORF Transcript_18712/g.55934 Transcript_18712/m.55934 type:complete len:193 (+) Transcript_18712:121-699(+)